MMEGLKQPLEIVFKPVKRFTAGTMKPGRTSPEGDTKIKGKTFTYGK